LGLLVIYILLDHLVLLNPSYQLTSAQLVYLCACWQQGCDPDRSWFIANSRRHAGYILNCI